MLSKLHLSSNFPFPFPENIQIGKQKYKFEYKYVSITNGLLNNLIKDMLQKPNLKILVGF